jgi:hypothetical protein
MDYIWIYGESGSFCVLEVTSVGRCREAVIPLIKIVDQSLERATEVWRAGKEGRGDGWGGGRRDFVFLGVFEGPEEGGKVRC